VVYSVADSAANTSTVMSMLIAGGDPVVLLAGRRYSTPTFHTLSGDFAIGAMEGRLYAAPLAGGRLLQLSSESSRVIGSPAVSADGRMIYLARPADPAMGGTPRLMAAEVR